MVIITPDRDEFFRAVGEAVSEYARVEASQAALLESLLGIKRDQANAIFYSLQNVRSRNEMFQMLLLSEHGEAYKKFWASVSDFLGKMATFRNAIVHWHPIAVASEGGVLSGIHHPLPGRKGILIKGQLGAFNNDCQFIRPWLDEFAGHMRKARQTLGPTSPGKFARPLTHPNRADLQPPPMPKAPRAQPRSSRLSPQSDV